MPEMLSPQDLSQAIDRLVQTAQVTQRGYQDAAKHIGDKELAKLFGGYASQRQGFVTELQKLGPVGVSTKPGSETSVGEKQSIGWTGFPEGTNWTNEKAVLAEVGKMEQQAIANIEQTMKKSGMPTPVGEALNQQLALYKEGASRAKAILENPKAPERSQLPGIAQADANQSRPTIAKA